MAKTELNSENFDQEINGSDIPYLVDFWAPWCGPCQMLNPVIDEIATDYDGRIKIGSVNIDNANDLANKHNVMTVPTLILYKNGQPEERLTGFQNKEQLEDLLDKHV